MIESVLTMESERSFMERIAANLLTEEEKMNLEKAEKVRQGYCRSCIHSNILSKHGEFSNYEKILC